VRTYYVTPEDFGIERAPINAIQGGNASQNAEFIRNILLDCGGARQDVVLMNAAAGLVVGGKAFGLAHGLQLARESIRSGKAMVCLQKLVDLTQKLASS
jgi:anthranilate phosphoribosyltransferase